MSDPGATISLLRQDTVHKVGKIEHNGQTNIKGVGNNSLEQVSLIERFKFTTAFGNEWEEKTVDAAVLNEITHLKHEDLTIPIQKVLQCLRKHKPQIMIEYGHIFKIENFQTSRTQGDFD